MPKLTPEQAADKWSRRTQGAVADYTAGVQAVTESPMAAAAASEQKMLQNLMESVNSGRWKEALLNVSLADWKDAAATKGSQRLAAGVQGAVDKQAEYYRRVFPVLERIQGEIDAMPNLTIEDSIARAAHLMRAMHAFKTSGR